MKPKSKSKSNQDRSRLKKSKSDKRKRPRCSSSDSADTGRKKPHGKSNDSKKKKKLRHISPPSTSSSYSTDYSVSSCSTCEKQKASRSTSPISRRGRGNRKSKPRKGRVTTSSKYKGRQRGRSHKRSRSCSTSSTSTSSGTCSPKRSRSTTTSRSPTRSSKIPRERGKAEKGHFSRRVESGSEERDKIIPAYDDIVSSSKDEEKEIQIQSEEIAEVSGKVVSEKTQNDGTKRPPVVDVELILRQKALENFIKFHKGKKCGISEERQGSVSNEPNKNVGSLQGQMATETVREGPVLEESSEIITDMALKGKKEIIPNISKPKIRSVIVIPEDREVSEDNTAVNPYNTGEVSNCITAMPNHVEDELSKCSELNPNPNPSSSVVSGLEKIEGRHETATVKVQAGGEQYENKTFSRMHDGEMVQVSYKVYIPNKTPALARRKLQRGETSTSQI